MIPVYEFKNFSPTLVFNKIAKWSRERPTLKRKFHSIAEDAFRDDAQRFYDVVVDALRIDEFPLEDEFSIDDKFNIVEILGRNMFFVGLDEFSDVINVARIIPYILDVEKPERLNQENLYRHASLNCYDYDRLKEEVRDLLFRIGPEELKRVCPTLCTILKEAQRGEKDIYPARHLPFNNIKGKRAWRYQCLRIMDQILCESDRRITYRGMKGKIKEQAKELGIEVGNKDMSNETVRQYFSYLNKLISVEHLRGRQIKYHSGAYQPGENGYLYKIHHKYDSILGPGYQRVSAFTVDISIEEAGELRKEIGILRARYFRDAEMHFFDQFPLLSMIERMEEMALYAPDKNLVNKLPDSDILTLNYYSSELSEIKRKVKTAVAHKNLIQIPRENTISPDVLFPLTVKEVGDKWSLIAVNPGSNEIEVIAPDKLAEGFTCEDEKFDYDKLSRFENKVIGISPLLNPHMHDVTLEVTNEGIEEMESGYSPFQELDLDVKYRRDSYYDRNSSWICVSFPVYLNNDFFKAVYELDRKSKLISIRPMAVWDMYLGYYKEHRGEDRIPPEERKVTCKYLRKTEKDRQDMEE